MKDLLLLRHAKTREAAPDEADFDRMLTGRGQRDAGNLANWLVRRGVKPGLILCSAAQRTRETLAPLQEAYGTATPIRIEPRLYLADVGTILAILRETPSSTRSVLVIGHNPGLHELAAGLAAMGALNEAVERLGRKFVTTGLARLHLSINDWAKLRVGGEATVRLVDYLTPADFEPV